MVYGDMPPLITERETDRAFQKTTVGPRRAKVWCATPALMHGCEEAGRVGEMAVGWAVLEDAPARAAASVTSFVPPLQSFLRKI
ncbi:unnamed protein product [Sphagnum jensenii]|uniref:Uncharacterized protein n=1 Tax=Sphagnum jensenii TaxID=128206 RepID=A0ABP1A263_9BRYO